MTDERASRRAEPPSSEGKDKRGEDASQRDVARDGNNREKHHERSHDSRGSEREEGSQGRRHSFAPLETKPHRKHVAEESEESGQSGQGVNGVRAPLAANGRDDAAPGMNTCATATYPFSRVEQQGGNRQDPLIRCALHSWRRCCRCRSGGRPAPRKMRTSK